MQILTQSVLGCAWGSADLTGSQVLLQSLALKSHSSGKGIWLTPPFFHLIRQSLVKQTTFSGQGFHKQVWPQTAVACGLLQQLFLMLSFDIQHLLPYIFNCHPMPICLIFQTKLKVSRDQGQGSVIFCVPSSKAPFSYLVQGDFSRNICWLITEEFLW